MAGTGDSGSDVDEQVNDADLVARFPSLPDSCETWGRASPFHSKAGRDRTIETVTPEPAADSHESRVVTVVAAERMQPQLARAPSNLSRGERDVVLLVALSRLSHEEVAQALGISYGT